MAFILAVDFDGTLFEDSWPACGKPKWDIINKVKEFKEAGAEIVLWTCREGITLEQAVQRCKEVGLEFDAVNDNAPTNQKYMEEELKNGLVFATRKIFANFYVDDRARNLEIFLKIDAKNACQRHLDNV
jgi:hypothetical protein